MAVIFRAMTEEDYDAVYALWLTIDGFGIRSLDDSREGIVRFLRRNPGLSVVAVEEASEYAGKDDNNPGAERSGGEIVGAILCGEDGRRGCLYHVCVRRDHRRRGTGTGMVAYCMKALREAGINKVSLIAFTRNDVGNAFWKTIGWTKREDLHYYDFVLNEENITRFIGE